jgi:hypothetical protein
MSSSRIVLALAIVGSFAAGLSAGMYFSTPSPSRNVPAENADTSPSRDASSKGSLEFGKGHLDGDASGDPNAVAKRFWTALTISDEQERQAAWLAMLPNMTADNAAEIRELFRKMDKQGRWFVSEWNVFWKRWGEVDAAAALKDIENVGSQYHPDLAEKILKGWATTGSAEARTWLEANRASPSYHSALRGYLDGLARTNLDRATQDALTLGQGHNMHRLVEVLTEQALRQRELGGMVEWWKSLPEDPNDGSAKREAIQHVYWRMRIASNDQAGEWLAQLANTPYRPDTQIGNLAERMAQSDPAKALEWVTSLPPSPADGRYTAIGRTVNALAQRDPTAVETWLADQKPSPLRDQGLVAYATFLDRQAQAEAAQRWRAQVQDQRLLQSSGNRATNIIIETQFFEQPK